jgi:hypothetical protein
MHRDAALSTSVGRRSWITASLIVVILFTLGAAGSALRKPVAEGFDEVAHISYIAYLQTTGQKWPRFAEMRMIDPTTFDFNADQNYLNHPPFYYALMAVLGPGVTGRPASLIPIRLLNAIMAVFGLMALLILGRQLQLGPPEFYAFAAMIAATPVLAPLAGAVNNDNLGFVGGALGILGLYAYSASFGRRWLIVACGGMIAASAAKLTGLILIGTTLGITIALMAMRRKVSRVDFLIVAGSLIVAAAPYLVFIIQYGSPAPDTPAQSALLTSGANVTGWANEPRMAPVAYVVFFLKSFLIEWMPVLRPRNSLQLALLTLPATVILVSVAGWVVSARAILHGRQRPLDFLVVAGMASIALTLAVHIAFSYQRHVQTGWMMDAYPRYYLPLIAIIPMAALTFSSTIQSDRWRMVLVAFLIGAPIAFQVFGATMG